MDIVICIKSHRFQSSLPFPNHNHTEEPGNTVLLPTDMRLFHISVFLALLTCFQSWGNPTDDIATATTEEGGNDDNNFIEDDFVTTTTTPTISEEIIPPCKFPHPSRLPKTLTPKHYVLHIRPILDRKDAKVFTAPGTVQISVECLEPTREIVLNALDLQINDSSVQVWSYNDDGMAKIQLEVLDQVYDKNDEKYGITVNETLKQGKIYEVYIEFVAKVRGQHAEGGSPMIIDEQPVGLVHGLQWGTYVGDDGQNRYLAIPRLGDGRGLRRTLPSFDEPDKKATWDINVGRQFGFHSLSNMNLVATENITELPGWSWDRFNRTPIITPYTIGFVVSDLQSVTANETLFDKPVKAWVTPAMVNDNRTKLFVNTAARALSYFQQYFEMEYELPKMDLFVAPGLTSWMGAVETWGLSLYVESVITSFESKDDNNLLHWTMQEFVIIIAHEMAHQYWGNLVTHAWWNDWWLSEGFATYFTNPAIDALFPGQFDAVDYSAKLRVEYVQRVDAALNSTPVHGANNTHLVNNPMWVDYDKGATMVNMLRGITGSEEIFRKACIYFLKKRAHTAVHQDALFEDWTEYLNSTHRLPSNNKTVGKIMESWTTQRGFPLVRVKRDGPRLISVTQEPFENRDDKVPGANNRSWDIPIWYISGTDPSFSRESFGLPKFWIDRNRSVANHEVDTNQWILVNPDSLGPYKVLYDDHFSELLLGQLEKDIDSIPVGSRCMLVDSYFSAANQGYITMEKALKMTSFLKWETNYYPWQIYMKYMKTAFKLFQDHEGYEKFKSYSLGNMQAILDRVGLTGKPGDFPITTIARMDLQEWTCPLRDQGCVKEGERRASIAFTKQNNSKDNEIPPLDQFLIICGSADNSKYFDILVSSPEYFWEAMEALVCTTNKTQLEKLWGNFLEKNGSVLPQNNDSSLSTGYLTVLISNPVSRRIIRSALASNATYVLDRIGPIVINALPKLAEFSSTKDILDMISDFRDKFGMDSYDTITHSLSIVEKNMDWMEKFGRDMLTWFGKFG